MQTLIKYDNSWREKRTWKYNTVNPGKPYKSLLDRVEKDDVSKPNIILTGGWTADTLLFLPRLVEQARDQKEWNHKCDHISFADRRAYYLRRSERFKLREGASGEAASCSADAPQLSEAEIRETQVRALGEGKRFELASAPPTRAPNPAIKFSSFWSRDDTARWGYASVKEFAADQKADNLPYQRRAPGGAASSDDTQMSYVGPAGPGGPADPYPDEMIENCLQCNEPSALPNLWHCDRCTRMLKKPVYYHRPSKFRTCYDDHLHYCNTRALFGWQR